MYFFIFLYGPQCLLYFYLIYSIQLFPAYRYWYSTLFIYITAPFGFSYFFGIQRQHIYFILFFIVFLILPSWINYFICLCIPYVCTYHSPLFTCVIDQTGCRRENGTEPVIASARCLTARSLPTIPWISPWGGTNAHRQLHSLNRLRPLLRHAPPALRLVSRFPIPLYLLRTLG